MTTGLYVNKGLGLHLPVYMIWPRAPSLLSSRLAYTPDIMLLHILACVQFLKHILLCISSYGFSICSTVFKGEVGNIKST